VKFFFLCENNAEKYCSYNLRRGTRGLRDRLGKGMDDKIILLEQAILFGGWPVFID
jgi:hypothetical protein